MHGTENLKLNSLFEQRKGERGKIGIEEVFMLSRTGLDTTENTINHLLCPESNHDLLVVQPVAYRRRKSNYDIGEHS
jgi:hypothetical protein